VTRFTPSAHLFVDARPWNAFAVTDGRATVQIAPACLLPDLFRRGAA
jgi:hypothetical protein